MSTFRVDLVAHLNTAVGAYITANPTIIRRYWKRRPGSFGEMPCAYMETINESIQVLDNGTFQRNLASGVVVVDTFGDNEQTGGRFDIAVDALVSWLIKISYANVAGGIMNLTGVEEFDLEQSASLERPPVIYRAARINLSGQVQEGRPS